MSQPGGSKPGPSEPSGDVLSRRTEEQGQQVAQWLQGEAGMRAESELHRAIIELAAEGLCICHEVADPPYLRFTVWNPRMKELTGYTLEEINSQGWFPSVCPDPEVQARARQRMARLREGDDLAAEEWEITRKNGEKRTLAISTSVLRSEEGTSHLLARMQDVTERKRAEGALRSAYAEMEARVADRTAELVRTNQRLQQEILERQQVERALRIKETAIASSINAIAIAGLDGKLDYVNHSFVRMWGYQSAEEVIGTSPLAYWQEPGAAQAVIEALQAHGQWVGELVARRKDGSTFDAHLASNLVRNEAGEPVCMLGWFLDVTEREQIRRALQESEQRHRALFETMAQGVVYQDRSGAILSANPAAQRILGLTLDQLRGRTSLDPRWRTIREDGSDLPGEEHPAMLALRSGREVRDTVMGIRNPRRQSHVWIEVNAVPQFRPGEDRPYQVYTTFDEITERREAEQRLRQANQELSALVAELRLRDYEATRVRRMTDLLQTCNTREEAYEVIAASGSELFDGEPGCLAIVHGSGRFLEAVARWGQERRVESVFPPDHCWAIRRGQPHEVGDPRSGLLCHHFVEPPTSGYLCWPLLVRGENLGLLYLGAAAAHAERAAARHRLGATVTEAIKLSLSSLKLREELHEQATHDPLTGLFNRRYVQDTLPRELHRALRNKSPLGVAMVDLDHLKRFNDSFGHDAGDALLRELGRALRDGLRRSDIACRYGGEEFVVILPDSGPADTQRRLEQIRLQVKGLAVRYGAQVLGPVTISVGIAQAPEHGQTSESLLLAADQAMYSAKRAGRDCVVVCEAVGR